MPGRQREESPSSASVHADNRGKDGKTYSPGGDYEKVVPNETLIFSWKWADTELMKRITIQFKTVGDTETELTLTHEGFPDTEVAIDTTRAAKVACPDWRTSYRHPAVFKKEEQEP